MQNRIDIKCNMKYNGCKVQNEEKRRKMATRLLVLVAKVQGASCKKRWVANADNLRFLKKRRGGFILMDGSEKVVVLVGEDGEIDQENAIDSSEKQYQEKKIKIFEVCTQVQFIDIDDAKVVLVTKECIKDWAYVLHDCDVLDSGEVKKAHYHIVGRLDNAWRIKDIANWFGVPYNFVKSATSKRKGDQKKWSDMLAYLTHMNAPKKHQYDAELVVSNFDFMADAEQCGANKQKNRLNEIIGMIDNGQIREYNYHDHITMQEYISFKRQINIAFEYRMERLRGVDRQMEGMFITGQSESGKTLLAREIAEKRGLSCYVSGSGNDPLDGYKGEDCIILDDLRGSVICLSDLLKMLDNNTASSVKSRYRNKVLECRLMIITTIKTIDEFFNTVFAEEPEPIVQLKRRCKTHIRVTDDYYYTSIYLPKERAYGDEFMTPNTVLQKYEKKEMTVEEQRQQVMEMLGITDEDITYLAGDEKNDNVIHIDGFREVSDDIEQLDWELLCN